MAEDETYSWSHTAHCNPTTQATRDISQGKAPAPTKHNSMEMTTLYTLQHGLLEWVILYDPKAWDNVGYAGYCGITWDMSANMIQCTVYIPLYSASHDSSLQFSRQSGYRQTWSRSQTLRLSALQLSSAKKANLTIAKCRNPANLFTIGRYHVSQERSCFRKKITVCGILYILSNERSPISSTYLTACLPILDRSLCLYSADFDVLYSKMENLAQQQPGQLARELKLQEFCKLINRFDRRS